MSRPLRLISVCRSLPTPTDPSAGVFVLNRLAALSRIADVRVVQPIPYLPQVRPLPEWAYAPSRMLGGLEIHHAPMLYVPGVLKWLDAIWLARAIAPRVSALHAIRPVDLLDAHFGYPDGAGCVRVGRRLGLPVFITLRGFEQERVHQPIVRRELIGAMRAAAGCIAVSHTLEALALRHGVPAERVRVVHNAIDAAVFTPGDRLSARQRLGIRGDAGLIVSVGHLITRKRHHVLLDAFAEVRRRIPAATLAIIGARADEPEYPARLRRQAEALGIDGAVRWVGNLPQREVVDWLRAADVFSLLSAREGCCNAVLEALAVGVPTVATDAGDNARFVTPGSNGSIVAIDDARATAEALTQALGKSDWDRPRIAQTLRAQVGDWNVVAGRVAEFFGERLARWRTAAHDVAGAAA